MLKQEPEAGPAPVVVTATEATKAARVAMTAMATKAMAVQGSDGTVLEAKKSRVKPPPMFKVLLLNDDYTPMDFVVAVLQSIFAMTREQATQVMLKVHRDGMGVCGVYPRDLAESKVEQVLAFARKHQHPLKCVMEET